MVLASAGDVPARELTAAVAALRRSYPEAKSGLSAATLCAQATHLLKGSSS
ncbi:hypothetical protein ACIRVK_39950 [Streptomyces sp. NPDC101152]|uniref:hypothetical protein n=1 Tax=Streptomyces sp. NPDC101152 TaxID=3366116 RepID=UPI0038061B29